MKKQHKISIIIFIIGCFSLWGSVVYSQNLGGGSGTISQLDQWVGSTTPSSNITQKTYGKAVKITGIATGQCLTLDENGIITTTTCGGNVATSSAETINYVPYWTSTGATPATLGSDPDFVFNGTNVGIGTTSPYARLSVVGEVVAKNFTATSTGTGLLLDGGSLGSPAIRFSDGNTLGIFSDNADNISFGSGGYKIFEMQRSSITEFLMMSQLATGQVNFSHAQGGTRRFTTYIAGSPPFYSIYNYAVAKNIITLEPSSGQMSLGLRNAVGVFNIDSSATGYGYTTSMPLIYTKAISGLTADAYRYQNSSAVTLANITAAGGAYFADNVGIGTTSPYAKLSVVGEVVASNFTATSTTATNIFMGEVLIGTSTTQAFSRAFTIGATTGFQFRVSSLGAITNGSYQASPVEVPYGGTGMSLVTQGSILFGDTSTALAQDNSNLFWDNANNRLGIGNAAPSQTLHVTGNGIITGGLQVGATANTTAGTATIDGNFVGAINVVNGTITTKTTLSSTNPPYSFIGDTNTGIGQFTLGADTLSIATAGLTRLTVDASGNLGIGTTSPYAKLSVVGQTVSEYFTATSTTATSTLFGALQIGSTAGDQALKITARSGGYPASDSVGGMVNFTNTNNFGSALNLYSNAGVGRTNDILKIKNDNVLNDQRGLFVSTDGTRSAALFDCTNTTRVTGGECVNITDVAGANRTTLGISGAPIGLGLLKFTVNAGADANASALSMQIDDVDPQGFFIDTVAGYVGKFLNFRNNGIELLTLNSAGNLGLGTSTPYAKLSVVGEIVGSHFTATSTTATTTINGTLKLGSTGTSASQGNATLVAGTVTVTTGAATTNGFVHLTRKTSGGTLGTAITYTITNGSFTITSDSALDTSTFTWLITH